MAVNRLIQWQHVCRINRKSVTNELDGFKFVVIISPFRTLLFFPAGFGSIHFVSMSILGEVTYE